MRLELRELCSAFLFMADPAVQGRPPTQSGQQAQEGPSRYAQLWRSVSPFRINTYGRPVSVDSKPFMRSLSPLDATLTKKQGVWGRLFSTRQSVHRPTLDSSLTIKNMAASP